MVNMFLGFKHLWHDKNGDLAEAALTFPVLLLVTLGLINMGLVGFAAVNASNAANYGARLGSVAQDFPGGTAENAAWEKLNATPVGDYAVNSWGGGAPGQMIGLRVAYSVPNWFQGLAALFGVETTSTFEGNAVTFFRQEGW